MKSKIYLSIATVIFEITSEAALCMTQTAPNFVRNRNLILFFRNKPNLSKYN